MVDTPKTELRPVESMKPSLVRDFIYGALIFLLLATVILLGGKVPQFVYVMF